MGLRKAPTALGMPEQEEMRDFLGCDRAPKDAGYDFCKGAVKFEYKYSRLYETHPQLVRKHKNYSPQYSWTWDNLQGHTGGKTYDYLILEGGCRLPGTKEGLGDGTETFLIPRDDFLYFNGGKTNRLQINARLNGGKTTTFVRNHRKNKKELKEFVNQLAPGREPTARSVSPCSLQGKLFA